MTEINLNQAEAEMLIAMEKHRINNNSYSFPKSGESIFVPLTSIDKREAFILDIGRGRIDLQKVSYQNRARQVVSLVRLDLGGSPHRNPDGREISAPHIHVYREGFGDKWASPIPIDKFTDIDDIQKTLYQFMDFCNITIQPRIQRGLFS